MIPAGRPGLHRIFEASILLKGMFAAFEMLIGLILLTPFSRRALHFLRDNGLQWAVSDPDDRFSPFVLRHLSTTGPDHQYFWAIYLIGHGLIKLVVVLALARRWYSAYPLAMLVLAGFIVWQMLDWRHSGSVAMLALSAFDAFIIWLTWGEWQAARQTRG